jgi:hypothetical protein
MHERVEGILLEHGWRYDIEPLASHRVASVAESRVYMARGITMAEAETVYAPLFKAEEHEKIVRLPPNLHMEPYLEPPIDRRLVARMLAVMSTQEAVAAGCDLDLDVLPVVREIATSPMPIKRWDQPWLMHAVLPGVPRFDMDDLVAGYRAGNVDWDVTRLGPPPGSPRCRVDAGILHEAIIGVEPWPDNVPVPMFGPRIVCTKCGIVGADARPNWREHRAHGARAPAK